MRLRRHAAALSIAVLVTALGGAGGGVATAAGGAKKGPDLSTVDAAKAYLISQGYDPSRFTFQVGLKNYSGAQCPGLDWNCTTDNLIVQIAAPGGINWADCPEDAQQCVIVQGTQQVDILQGEGNEANMHGHCPDADPGHRLMARESTTLTCTITQNNTTPGGNNHAVVGMAIHDNDGSTQFAQEDAVVEQFTLGDGDNHAVVHEEIVLDTNDGATQKQDAFQSLKLTQTTETGDNYADVKESQKITAHADSDGSEQLQQTTERPGGDPCTAGPAFDANSCVEFEQSTESGRNTLIAHMDHDVAAVAAGDGAEQTQGCTSKSCGLELTGTQGEPGLTTSPTNAVDDNQTIHYTLNGPEGTMQIQDPPAYNGPGVQTGSLNDLWEVDQLAVLTANDADDVGDMQAHINEVNDTSTGTVDAQSVISLNGERSEFACSGPSCFYIHTCTSGECGVVTEPPIP